MPRRVRISLTSCLTALLLAAITLAGCASGTGTDRAAGCGDPTRESLDPRSLQHVLPGGPVPSYLTDPPTSGPHQPTPPIAGAQKAPIPAVQQVGLLEAGTVLIQYKGLRSSDVQRIESLVGPDVVVAPAAKLPPKAEVVATAWLYKLSCSTLDIGALEQFISERKHHGPGTN